MQSFHNKTSSETCVCYLECCHLLVLMLAYECDCLIVSLSTEVVLSLLRAHGSETPDHDITWVQVNSYAGVQLLQGVARSQRKDYKKKEDFTGRIRRRGEGFRRRRRILEANTAMR